MPKCKEHVIVVGGGVIGLMCASTLLERSPEVTVLVLEKAEVGSGASQYAGTIDIPYFRSELHRRLVEVSWAWHEKHNSHGYEYRSPVAMAWYAQQNEVEDELYARILTPLSPRDVCGPPSDGSQSWQVPPGLREFDGQAFVIDTQKWCRALAKQIDGSGRGKVVEHTHVIAVEEEAVMKVRCADGKVYSADHVAVCIGPWLVNWNGESLAWAEAHHLRTKRVFGLNIEIDKGLWQRRAIGWPSADLYFHPAHDSTQYRLSLRHDEWDVDPDQPGPMVASILERCALFLDGLLGRGRWSVAGHRVFVDSYTADFMPLVAHDDSFRQQVTIATGTHGSGVRLAPGIADLAANMVLTRLRHRDRIVNG